MHIECRPEVPTNRDRLLAHMRAKNPLIKEISVVVAKTPFLWEDPYTSACS